MKLLKHGDLSQCGIWIGITLLLSITSKVFTRIIHDRMKDTLVDTLRDVHADFRKECSCMDMIAILRVIVEQTIEGRHLSMSVSLTLRRHLTVWTDRQSGTFFSTTACPKGEFISSDDSMTASHARLYTIIDFLKTSGSHLTSCKAACCSYSSSL